MILRTTFKNILSFKEETIISFVAGKSTAHAEQVLRADGRDDISVLKAGIIYGANASGKSNIIKCIYILKLIALGRFPKHHIEPFKLANSKDSSSKLEVEFKIDGHYYAYGVEFNISGIEEEWLYEINARTDKEIFTRKVGDNSNKFTFGTVIGDKETSQFLKFLADGTPTDTSFISEYVKRNGRGMEHIRSAFRWFRDKLNILFPESRYQGISFNAERDRDFQTSTCKLLDFFDTGIEDIRRIGIKSEEIDVPKDLLGKLISDLEPGKTVAITSEGGNQTYFIDMEKDGVLKYYKQKTVHRDDNGDEVLFEEDEESDGSIRLLDFIPMLIDLKHHDDVFLIDEIDRSLHPMLSQRLLECYFSILTEEKKHAVDFYYA
jgi:AAA15 family ATPase/GTPase